MIRKLKKKLLDLALTVTGRLHLHSIYFWILENNFELAEEIANEPPYKISQEEADKMFAEIMRKSKEAVHENE